MHAKAAGSSRSYASPLSRDTLKKRLMLAFLQS
jgi:hypothetical protein